MNMRLGESGSNDYVPTSYAEELRASAKRMDEEFRRKEQEELRNDPARIRAREVIAAATASMVIVACGENGEIEMVSDGSGNLGVAQFALKGEASKVDYDSNATVIYAPDGIHAQHVPGTANGTIVMNKEGAGPMPGLWKDSLDLPNPVSITGAEDLVSVGLKHTANADGTRDIVAKQGTNKVVTTKLNADSTATVGAKTVVDNGSFFAQQAISFGYFPDGDILYNFGKGNFVKFNPATGVHVPGTIDLTNCHPSALSSVPVEYMYAYAKGGQVKMMVVCPNATVTKSFIYEGDVSFDGNSWKVTIGTNPPIETACKQGSGSVQSATFDPATDNIYEQCNNNTQISKPEAEVVEPGPDATTGDAVDSGDTETGDTETGDTETGDTETGDTETGDTETGNTETGDTETGDTETGDTETGDTETGDTETGDTETGDTETGDTETGDTETGDTETGDTETGDTETGDTETGDTETGDTETGDTTQPVESLCDQVNADAANCIVKEGRYDEEGNLIAGTEDTHCTVVPKSDKECASDGLGLSGVRVEGAKGMVFTEGEGGAPQVHAGGIGTNLQYTPGPAGTPIAQALTHQSVGTIFMKSGTAPWSMKNGPSSVTIKNSEPVNGGTGAVFTLQRQPKNGAFEQIELGPGESETIPYEVSVDEDTGGSTDIDAGPTQPDNGGAGADAGPSGDVGSGAEIAPYIEVPSGPEPDGGCSIQNNNVGGGIGTLAPLVMAAAGMAVARYGRQMRAQLRDLFSR